MVINLQPKVLYTALLTGKQIQIFEVPSKPSAPCEYELTLRGEELPGGIYGTPYAAIASADHYETLHLMVRLGKTQSELRQYCKSLSCNVSALMLAHSIYPHVHQSAVKSKELSKSTSLVHSWFWDVKKPTTPPGNSHALTTAIKEMWNFTVPLLGQRATQMVLVALKRMVHSGEV